MDRRLFLQFLGVAGGSLAGIGSASAQAFPTKPIRVVVPSGAGGASDIVTRLFQKAIDKTAPQPIVVQNMPGGGTSIGGREVTSSAPDGYTVLMMHEGIISATAQGIFTPGIDALTPVATTGRDVYSIVVSGTSPYKTLKDLYDAARDGKTVRTAVNIGGLNHLTSLIAADAGKVTIRPVQHGSGADSVRSLLGDQVEVIFAVPSDVIEYYKAGQMRILGIMATERSPFLPDVPTTAEAGYPSVSELNHMWWLPKQTPPERVTWLKSQLQTAMADEEIKKQFASRMIEPVFSSGPELAAEVAAKKTSTTGLVERFGLKQQ